MYGVSFSGIEADPFHFILLFLMGVFVGRWAERTFLFRSPSSLWEGTFSNLFNLLSDEGSQSYLALLPPRWKRCRNKATNKLTHSLAHSLLLLSKWFPLQPATRGLYQVVFDPLISYTVTP